MKNTAIKLLFFAICSLFLLSCEKEDCEHPTTDTTPRNSSSIIPGTFLGRDINRLGSLELTNRTVTISVWDHGKIDGDIVSIYVNGTRLIARRTLKGPSQKYSVRTTLKYNGYNYILLYAHNVGSISPNTAAMSIYDGVRTRNFTLESNLKTNGAIDLIVD